MSGIDDFTSYHEELLEGHYDCVDRIVVNAYFEYAQSAGGFRSWWRSLMGSDETLDRAHLERMAGRLSVGWKRMRGRTRFHFCCARPENASMKRPSPMFLKTRISKECS